MMDWLPAIALREPWWLLLAPLSWAACLWWRHPGHGHTRLRGYAEPHLLKWLIVEPTRGRLPLLTLLGWSLIAIAISGPVLVDRERESARHGLDIAVVLDISPSMLVDDVAPNRLQRARLELDDFLHRLGDSDRVTLIAFSAHAYRLMPLTTDTALVSWFLDALDPSLTRHHGSNVVAALEQAARTLGQDSALDNRAILLISDGEFPEPEAVHAATERLAGHGIAVFALGVGTPTGGPVPAPRGYLRNARGETVISRLDRAMLAQITATTGGRYSDVHADDRDQDQLFAGLDRLAQESRPVALAEQGIPLYPWLLAFGLGLLLATRLQRPLPAMPVIALPLCALAVGMMLAPADGQAAGSSERRAFEALEAGRHAEAERLYRGIDGYRGRLGQGAAAYRMARWSDALAAFSAAAQLADDDRERAKALYNSANALVRLDRLDEALVTFDQALALHPNHARAALNRDLVNRALEQQTASIQDAHEAMQEDRDADDVSPGMDEDPQATGEPTDAVTTPLPGSEGERPQRRVIGRPRPGDGAPSTLSRFDAVEDNSREMLRHRFTLLDAMRPRSQEEQPW